MRCHRQALLATWIAAFSIDAGAQADASTVATPAEGSYGLPLALTYAATPLAAVGTAIAASDADETAGTIAGASVATVIIAGPFVVHALHDRPGRGAMASLLTPALTAGGALLLGLPALVIASDCTRSGDEASDTQSGCFAPVLWAGLVGAVAGYATWAVVDVRNNSSLAPPARSSLGVAPIVALGPRGSGFVGAAGRF